MTLGLVAAFVVVICLGMWQLKGNDEAKRVGEQLPTASFQGVTIAVPATWSVVTLDANLTCAPTQDRTIVVAAKGLGGDCKSTKPGDSSIWLTVLSPLETAPPTTTPVGNLTGWVHHETRSSTELWIAAIPKSNMQISFNGPIDATIRQSVIDSVK